MMDKFFFGIAHMEVFGVSATYLIDEVKPTKVCIEAYSIEFARKCEDICPIVEKCEVEGIPIIPLDIKLDRKQEVKACISEFFGLICHRVFRLVARVRRWSSMRFWDAITRLDHKLPFHEIIFEEREREWIKRIDEADNGEGTMLIITGLGHTKTLREHYKNDILPHPK